MPDNVSLVEQIKQTPMENEIQVAFTDKKVTAWGGMKLMHNLG